VTIPSETTSGTVTVSVALFADLRRYAAKGEEGPRPVAVPAGTTVEELFTAVGLPEDQEIRKEITVGLNDELGSRTHVLKEGDRVVLFSPMEGG
jgi:molybdopterin converting factor small subunit